MQRRGGGESHWDQTHGQQDQGVQDTQSCMRGQAGFDSQLAQRRISVDTEAAWHGTAWHEEGACL